VKNMPWYGYIILAGFIVALAFFAYFKPKNQELENVRANRTKVEREVRDLREKKKELDLIETEIAELNKSLEELEAFIPRKKEVADILRRIEQLATDARLTMVRYTPRPEIPREFYNEWPIPIEITGNYHSLGVFFDRLSRFPRIFTVENFSIKTLSKQVGDATITANWTAKTYIFRDDEPAPAKPAAKTTRKK